MLENTVQFGRIKIVTGPRKNGKSERAEAEAAPLEHKLYLGTLTRTRGNQATIDKHISRRGTTWTTIEASGDFQLDLIRLDQGIANSGSDAGILIDGLTSWIDLSAKGQDLIGTAEQLGRALADSIFRWPNISWWLVDVSQDQLEAEGDLVGALAAETINRILLSALMSRTRILEALG